MKFLRWFAALAFAIPLSAQTPKDSLHVSAQTKSAAVLKARLDSVNRALAQCAATKSCAGYLKAASPISQRALAMFPGLFEIGRAHV